MKLGHVYFIVVMNLVAMHACAIRLVPRSVLFGAASYDAPSLSPDGSTIAYLAPCNGVMNICTRPVGSDVQRQITFEKERGIKRYFWAPDSAKIFYMQDADGNENWHIFSVDLISLDKRDYTPFAHVRAYIIAVENTIKDSILIGLNYEQQSVYDAYKLNVHTGQLTMIAKNPGDVVDWYADRFLHVRYALKNNKDGGRDVIFRNHEHAHWTTLFSWSALEALSCSIIDISYSGRELYFLDNRYSDTTALTVMNAMAFTKKVIGNDPHYDITGVLLHPRLRTIQAYSVMKRHKEFVIIDKSVEPDLMRLRDYMTGDISVVSRDAKDERWLVAYVADNKPISYVLYDRIAQTLEPLFDNKPALKRYDLAPTESVDIVARDGIVLEGYCTKPLGWRLGQRLPMVIVVHGGPWSRDVWGYNMEALWLASRGYICLRVNYRGSLGYGKTFLGLGTRQWGGAMLNDLVDAAQWAIDTGFADPKRIGIMGFSYGGYAALCGTTMTQMFACGISGMGPSNLVTFLQSLSSHFEQAKRLLYTMVGDPHIDADFLQSRSPLSYVDYLKVPLLIAQGSNDPRVNKHESEQIINALRERNLPHDYVLFYDEGHGLTQTKNRMIFYERAERFLADILHGLYEA